jgi:hypothetical protein
MTIDPDAERLERLRVAQEDSQRLKRIANGGRTLRLAYTLR